MAKELKAMDANVATQGVDAMNNIAAGHAQDSMNAMNDMAKGLTTMDDDAPPASAPPAQPTSPKQAMQSPTNADRKSDKGSKGSKKKPKGPKPGEEGEKDSQAGKKARDVTEDEKMARTRKMGERIVNTGDDDVPEGMVMLNGQLVNVRSQETRVAVRHRLENMGEDTAKWNELRVLVCRVMKNSSKWGQRFKNLEINDDPLKRWAEPIIYVTLQARFHMILKAMRRMNNYIVRCMVLNPENEPDIVVLREKMEDKLYELRRLTELEEPYKEIFTQTMYNLTKIQSRLEVLQQGMGFSESEASVSSDCNDEALDELKNTRKSMQYTIASLI